jgi:hypothetical protein
MTILALIPNPESAASVAAWAEVFAANDEGTRFVCYELGFDGRTTQALTEALGEKAAMDRSPEKLSDPAPIRQILRHVHKTGSRLLVTAPFTLPTDGGKAQTSDELLQSAPCLSFATLYGSKAPGAIKRILLIDSADPHDQAALRLVDTMRERLDAEVTIGYVEDETGAKPLQFGLKGLRAKLHEAAVEEDAFTPSVVVDRL